jgi:hypothetical protein
MQQILHGFLVGRQSDGAIPRVASTWLPGARNPRLGRFRALNFGLMRKLLIRSPGWRTPGCGNRDPGRSGSRTPRPGAARGFFFSARRTCGEHGDHGEEEQSASAGVTPWWAEAFHPTWYVEVQQQARAGVAMHLDCQPVYPIGRLFRKNYKAFSVITVFSALYSVLKNKRNCNAPEFRIWPLVEID